MFFPSILSPFTTHMKLGICSVNQFPFRHGVPLAESDIFNGLKVLSSSQFTRFFYLPRHRYDWTALFKLGHRPPWTWMEENKLEWITGGLSCIFSDLPVLPSKWSSKSVFLNHFLKPSQHWKDWHHPVKEYREILALCPHTLPSLLFILPPFVLNDHECSFIFHV